MSDGYGRDRDYFEPHVRGRIFENGAEKFFRDREKGYAKGSRKYEFRDRSGRTERIQFDKIKNEQDRDRADSIEEKSGRIEGRKDEKQLRGIRELLKKGEINRHTLRSVEGEFISKDAQELIRGLIQDFGDRFTHQIISRADAREIWARGLELEPGRQLELPGVGEKARQQRTQQREAKGQRQLQERPRVQETAQRSIEQQGRVLRAPEQRQQHRDAIDRLAQRAHERREAQARGERTPMSGREAADVLRARERARVTKEKTRDKERVQEAALQAIGRQERERKAPEQQQKQREAADRLAQRAIDRREAAARGERTPMSAREAADVLRLGPPIPSAQTARREPPPVAPGVRSSRNRSRERDRDRSRGVERER
ncbi:hypothetical protein ACFWPH_14010 [Nocardia sp. NPDC058499]|uniref:hypothetical protein n=1 Tax=Nocardia sp. NPDC058499 TaxID=3346530 RepID=UPI0036646E36